MYCKHSIIALQGLHVHCIALVAPPEHSSMDLLTLAYEPVL